eukprot:10296797-Lingulodinium_polyedra.AAC.1
MPTPPTFVSKSGGLVFLSISTKLDDLFRTWLAGCSHTQVSHSRNMKRYREGLQYRSGKMSSQDQGDL